MRKTVAVLLLFALFTGMLPAHTVRAEIGHDAEEPLQIGTVAASTGHTETPVLLDSESATLPDVQSPLPPVEETAATGTPDPIGAASKGKMGDLTWTYRDGTLTVSGTGAIPDYTVNSKPSWVKSHPYDVSRVVIESGVTRVGNMAFTFGGGSIREVSLPDTLKTIGARAFSGCGMGTIHIPAGVTTLEAEAFRNCTGLRTITGCKGLKKIGEQVFTYSGLESFPIGKKMKDLNRQAFEFCNSLKAFEGGGGVYTVMDGVAYTDSGKTLYCCPVGRQESVSIPEGVERVADSAFAGCRWLTGVSFPDTMQELGEYAFQDCTGIKEIIIPDSVTSAGDYTFINCSGLASLTFGTGLKSTSYQMFDHCSGLKKINFGGLREIGVRSFSYCIFLTSLTIPPTIENLGAACFGECNNLRKLTYEPSCDYVPYQAFFNSDSLIEVNLKEGIRYIDSLAFWSDDDFYKLKRITLPADIVYSADRAFSLKTKVKPPRPMTAFGDNGYVLTDDLHLTGRADYTAAYEMLEYVNQKRIQAGKNRLYMDDSLLIAAMQRAAETAVLFSHTRPDSTECFYICPEMTAEIIAAGKQNPQQVADSWIQSEEHRNSILNGGFTSAGAGCFEHNGVTYWVLCFGTDQMSEHCRQPKDAEKSFTVPLFVEDFYDCEEEGPFYEFSFTVAFDPQSVAVGKTAKAKLMVINPGLSGKSAVLDDGCCTFKSAGPKTAAVTEEGTVTGKKSGTAVIYAKLPNRGRVGDTEFFVELPFKDVHRTDAFYAAVSWAYGSGIVKGKSQTIFAPKDGLTRGEFCTMLWRMWGKPAVTDADVEAMPFADAKASNHKKGIAWCYHKGIINGYRTDDGVSVFKPANRITRGNIVIMLFKIAKQEQDYQKPVMKRNPFRDVKATDKNMIAYRWLCENEIYVEKTLRAADKCTRAEMVGFLYGYNNAYSVIKH